jgi:hypothetical protein
MLRSLSYVIYKWLLYPNVKCGTSPLYVSVRIKHTIISVCMPLICSCFSVGVSGTMLHQAQFQVSARDGSGTGFYRLEKDIYLIRFLMF